MRAAGPSKRRGAGELSLCSAATDRRAPRARTCSVARKPRRASADDRLRAEAPRLAATFFSPPAFRHAWMSGVSSCRQPPNWRGEDLVAFEVETGDLAARRDRRGARRLAAARRCGVPASVEARLLLLADHRRAIVRSALRHDPEAREVEAGDTALRRDRDGAPRLASFRARHDAFGLLAGAR